MMHRLFPLLIAAGLSVGVSPILFGEEPTPTPSPETAEKAPKEQPKRPKTLSDLAGGIKLKPVGNGAQDSEKGIVIDNSNLKEMGEGAVITEAKPSSGSGPVFGTSEKNSGTQGSSELDQLQDKIEQLKKQRKALGQVADERDKANMYVGAGPQYRPPGVTDPLDSERQRLDKELAAAQRELAERKKRTRRPSRRPAAAAPPAGEGGG